MAGEKRGKLLSSVSSILISCRDCGRSRVWFPDDFARVGCTTTTTVEELGKRLFCPACRAQGARLPNIIIESYPASEAPAVGTAARQMRRCA